MTFQAGCSSRLVALIQLCTHSRCFLFQVSRFGVNDGIVLVVAVGNVFSLSSHLFKGLRRLLEDSAVIKAGSTRRLSRCHPSQSALGVGITNDACKLQRDFGVDMKGVLDLSALAAVKVTHC